MFRKLALALTIGLLLVPPAAPVSAQPLTKARWVLVDTKINPDGAPLETTRMGPITTPAPPPKPGERQPILIQRDTTDTYIKASVGEGNMTYTYRIVWRSNLEPSKVSSDTSYSCTFTFDKPPREMVVGTPVELKMSAKFTGDYKYDVGCSLRMLAVMGASWKYISVNNKDKLTDSISYVFTPLERYLDGKKENNYILARLGTTECPACTVKWVYELRDAKPVAPTAQVVPTRTPIPQVSPPQATGRPTPTVRPERPETERERLERAIAQNLVDYVSLRKRLERDMAPLFKDADVILARLRDAQEMLEILAKAPESEKAPYRAEITKLKAEMSKLLESFESRTSGLTQVLDGIDSQFVSYSQRQELRDTLQGYRSDLKLLRMTLVLRSGNTEAFDKLFQEYRNDNNIATEVLVGNAFRQLMDGKTRLALESAQLALARDKDNGVAKQLIRDIELSYLSRIRDRLAEEQTVNASLFNEKLNGHGEQGVGAVIIDLFTTGIGESVRGIAGYYDFAQQVASLNIDEAAAQVAGIRFAEELRARGITFEEMKSMTPGKMQEVVRAQYGKEMSEEHARKLRQVLFDAFKNVDVDAIRRGDKTQFNIDLGRQYFDTEILQQDVADFASKQFSAWDTFLTFGPSAQLGRVAKLGVAQRLGLTAETTLQQALQRGLKIHELGRKLYQTESGAAMIDGIYQWEAFQIHVANAIKGRIGEVAYAAGNTAVQAALDKLTEPVKEELKKTIKQVSENYLGAEATASAGTALETVSNLIDFVGLNTDALQRGAYGVDKTQGLKDVIQREVTRSTAAGNNVGVAKLAQQPRSFGAFQQAVNTGGAQYVAELQDAKDRVKNAAQGLAGRRGGVLHHAEDTLTQMQDVAQAIRRGDTTQAQTLWNQMQTGSRAAFGVA
ncbi:MAG: hypothetical protein Q7R34_07795, partial [Dehalococcoidia bacterium]|nr:hypothetical protein [Dehalococcoidia bacterium]